MNKNSSRSHFVFQMSISGRNNGTEFNGALNLIDLAGSERLKKSQAVGSCKKETIKINASLSCLMKVIEAMGKGDAHIPFRESKLTLMLKEHL